MSTADKNITLPEGSIQTKTTRLNLGPTHPATHGVFQNILELDGEKIISTDITIGYVHRAIEKIAERRPLYQITPLTDRLNYCSSPINNMGWHTTCEKLLGISTPKRVDYLRVIIMELARIADHLICNSVMGVDAGAFTGFLYVMQYRELIYEIWEEICGARLTTNIGRIGGFERDFNDIAFTKLERFLKEYPEALKELESLLSRNRIFMDRTIGVGPISAERALNYGFTGPNLRAAGVDYDVRKDRPYLGYETYDFDVPVGEHGDIYDRYRVRLEEMWQSNRILDQALDRLLDQLLALLDVVEDLPAHDHVAAVDPDVGDAHVVDPLHQAVVARGDDVEGVGRLDGQERGQLVRPPDRRDDEVERREPAGEVGTGDQRLESLTDVAGTRDRLAAALAKLG